jgi:hypothetical protein
MNLNPEVTCREIAKGSYIILASRELFCIEFDAGYSTAVVTYLKSFD